MFLVELGLASASLHASCLASGDALVVSYLQMMLQATRLDPSWTDSSFIDTSLINYWASLEEEYSCGDVERSDASVSLFTQLLLIMLENVEYKLTPEHTKEHKSAFLSYRRESLDLFLAIHDHLGTDTVLSIILTSLTSLSILCQEARLFALKCMAESIPPSTAEIATLFTMNFHPGLVVSATRIPFILH